MDPNAVNLSWAEQMREQASICRKSECPLYATLLELLAADLDAGGKIKQFLEPFLDDPPRSLLPLRLLALLHRLALEGILPSLTSVGAEAFFEQVITKVNPDWRGKMPTQLQTNEVGRCCSLLPGFSVIAERTPLPWRLLELGASAGLNLNWDRYNYGGIWGDLDSPVVFNANRFPNGIRVPESGIDIRERRGCDLHPVAINADTRRMLLSFVWPEQSERLHLLGAALDVAARNPIDVEQADAVEWTRAQLMNRQLGIATVLFHSIFWLYLTQEARQQLEALITEEGKLATADSPLAWLRMELGGEAAEVTLTMWPGDGEPELIASSGYHGKPVAIQPKYNCSNGSPKPFTIPRA
jgi:hypothetical protein